MHASTRCGSACPIVSRPCEPRVETLIVVNSPKNWGFRIPSVAVVSARDYLTQTQYAQHRDARVYNLCRSYRYLTLGYYVSLLAEARGHRPLPTIRTIQDVRTQAVVQSLTEDLQTLAQRSLAPLRSPHFTLSIYFGQNLAKRYARLSLALFNLFPAPLLRAYFIRREEAGTRPVSGSKAPPRTRWELESVSTIPASDVPISHRPFVEEAAGRFFAGRVSSRRRRQSQPYELAILTNPQDHNPPSNAKALRRFARAAEAHGMKATFVTRDDYGRLAEFDALFIRATTSVNHFTYRFASRAEVEGLVVIDDPLSIVRCTNKVYLAELLSRHGVRTPPTTLVHVDNLERLQVELRYPCILKRPDGAFSQGVHKVDDAESFRHEALAMLRSSDLIVAQEFVPTTFDWRVGVLDRQVLFVCRYYMAPEHWQIIHWDGDGISDLGRFETMPVEAAPAQVVRTAVRAARLVGDGFYGVDLKEAAGRVAVLEINDNPSVDGDIEDATLGSGLYDRVMAVFRARIEGRRQARQRP